MKRTIFSILIVFFAFNALFAKDFTLIGTIIDKSQDKPLKSASITVYSIKDSSVVKGDYSDKDGKFKIENLPMGGYYVKINFVGYKLHTEGVRPMGNELVDLGKINLEPDAVQMKQVEVVDNMIRAEIKGDTTEFNSKAFKTKPNAEAEELVKKIPGVQIESSGNIKAHGEDVKQVLVNGKQYFGEDPMMAMKNIPAEVIDRVQIFDKMSDQAEFTGFDDGSRFKAMNLVTKGNILSYGKIYGGYGYEDKYTAGGSLTLIKNEARLSILGMSNNINQQNFNFQDIIGLFGSGGRLPPGGNRYLQRGGGSQFYQRPGGGHGPSSSFGDFFVGSLSGLTTTHAAGLNYVDQFGDNLKITSSYFLNYTDNKNEELLNRQYYIEGDTSYFYKQVSDNVTKNFNQRFSGRIEWKIDSLNSLLIRPNGNLQNTDYVYNQAGVNSGALVSDTSGFRLSDANSITNSDYSAYNISNETLFRHKFETKGRTLSLSINNRFNKNNGDSYLDSYTSDYFTQIVLNDSLNQLNNSINDGYAHSGNLMYTEPIGDSSQLSLSYNADYSVNNEDKSLFRYDETTGRYNILDSTLSNFAVSNTFNQKVGLGYRFEWDKFELNATLNYQMASFENDKTINNPFIIKRNYNNLLPFVRLSYHFNKASDLRMHFSASTKIPTISQLSPVVNNSNPLQITTGNPGLGQELNYSIFTRFFTIFNENRNNFFLMTYFSYTDNYISNQTIMTRSDTVVNGYNVMNGAQLIVPANFGRQLTSRTYSTISTPLDFIKSTLNFNAGFTYTETPGLINKVSNKTQTNAYTSGLDLNSNISDKIDFSIGISATANDVTNSVQQALNNTYYNVTSFARVNWTIWNGFFVSLDLNHLYTTGYSDGYNQNLFITNFGFGNRAIYKNNFDIKFQVFDIFDKTKNISRNVTDAYFEDLRSLSLKRYGLLTVSYYIRPF
jgi:hypothetical protein